MLDDEGVHRREHLVGLVDDEVGPLGEDRQLVVGHDGGDLDDHVARWSSPVISRSIHTSTVGTLPTPAATMTVVVGQSKTAFGRALARPGVEEHVELRGRFGFMAFHGGEPRAAHRSHRRRRCRGVRFLDLHGHPSAPRPPALPFDGRAPRAVGGARHLLGPRRRRRHRPRLRATTACSPRCSSAGATVPWPRRWGVCCRRCCRSTRWSPNCRRSRGELRGLHPSNPVNVPPGGGVQLELPPRVRGLGPVGRLGWRRLRAPDGGARRRAGPRRQHVGGLTAEPSRPSVRQHAGRRWGVGAQPPQCSGSEPLDDPAAELTAPVAHAVVEAARTALPELDLVDAEAPAAPELGPLDIAAGELVLGDGDPAIEVGAVGEHRALRRRPRADLAVRGREAK